jgi:2',3'-cyclic-nucleotide 2'-phosphodiesterase
MNILFLGDVIGKPGRKAVRSGLPRLIHREAAALVVVNGENASGGTGLKPDSARELLDAGADVLTTGNHIFRYKEIIPFLDEDERIVRPANYPPGTPGVGWREVTTPAGVAVGIINLVGRVFTTGVDCPFQIVEGILAKLRDRVRVILVDMHAETTSEKGAMGWFLDGRVSAVLGTHTHVQTADERVLPRGTAFLTDVGMCGPIDSVIGVKPELAIQRFQTQMPTRFEPATGPAALQGAVFSVDPDTGRATAIWRVNEVVK